MCVLLSCAFSMSLAVVLGCKALFRVGMRAWSMEQLEDEDVVDTRKETLVVGSLHHITVFAIGPCILSSGEVEWLVRGQGW